MRESAIKNGYSFARQSLCDRGEHRKAHSKTRFHRGEMGPLPHLPPEAERKRTGHAITTASIRGGSKKSGAGKEEK